MGKANVERKALCFILREESSVGSLVPGGMESHSRVPAGKDTGFQALVTLSHPAATPGATMVDQDDRERSNP